MRRGPLSKQEKIRIEENQQLSAEEIATNIDRSVEVVQKYMDSLNTETKTEPVQEGKVEEKKQSFFEKHLGKTGNATVMTESASQIAEKLKKPGRLGSSCIHKIK
jgi:hypothetical protein